MKPTNLPFCRKVLMLAAVLSAISQAGQAQVFTNHSNGELGLGFCKNAPFTEAFEVVVNIGRATNFVNLTPGTTVPVTGYTASGQLVTGSFSSFGDLSWSVFGDVRNNNVSGYPTSTLWLSMPRPTIGAQTDAPDRESSGVQQVVGGRIESIMTGAADISSRLGASNTFNSVTYVREPLNTNSITEGENLSTFIGGSADSTQGTFGDNWYDVNSSPINVENTTPDSFTSVLQSDLYEIRPTGNLDPNTHLTTGSAYYVGFFQLNLDGTMTFTRATATAPRPPAPVLTISRSGNTSSISFATTNGATYTLYATNNSGITNPVATWSVVGSPITGSGGTTNLTDNNATPQRVYRVGAH